MARPSRPASTTASIWVESSFSSAIASAGFIVVTLAHAGAADILRANALPRRVARSTTSILGKYLADRGPHLAAMVAYYALLAIFPFVFLTLSALGLLGQVSESSYLIQELKRILPVESEDSLISNVRTLQDNAQTFFWIGIIGMFWSSLGLLLGARVGAEHHLPRVEPRRSSAARGWAWCSSWGRWGCCSSCCPYRRRRPGWVHRHTSEGAVTTLATIGIPLIASGIASFVFLVVVYRVLTNVELHRGDVWPGAMFGAVLFAISFQMVPIYIQFATNLVTLQVFGGIVLLLVWLYLMANIIVLGAEINWRHWARTQPPEEVSGLA